MNDKTPKLSPREQKVLDGLLNDQSIKEIANQLELSPRTVNCYLSRARVKLGVKTNVAAVGKAVRIGIL
ncbi:MAG: LuxR C-terminal-related transcriptional regulator [Bacteroidales bacterium]